MPNTTRDDVVAKVLDIAKKYPAYGPARLANELGHIVCAATVYNILRRNGLARKLSRLLSLEEIPSDVKISPILARKLSRLKPASIYSSRPGYMLSSDTFYLCTLKGVGRVYQVAAIDTNSSFGAAYLYTDKSAKSAVDFMIKVYALFRLLGIGIYSVLTDNGKEYTSHWGSYHAFEEHLKKSGIKHKYTKVRSPWTNGYAERFNRTLLEEFYQRHFLPKTIKALNSCRMILIVIYISIIFKERIKDIDLKGLNLVLNCILSVT